MRISVLVVAIAAFAMLAACEKEKCTSDVAERKLAELMTKVRDIGGKFPGKLLDLAPKLADIQAKAAAETDDMQAVCTAIDQIMAELNG